MLSVHLVFVPRRTCEEWLSCVRISEAVPCERRDDREPGGFPQSPAVSAEWIEWCWSFPGWGGEEGRGGGREVGLTSLRSEEISVRISNHVEHYHIWSARQSSHIKIKIKIPAFKRQGRPASLAN